MKNILKAFSFLFVIAVLITACNDDFLNTQPLDKASEDLVWGDAALSESFVTDIYNGIRDGLLDQRSQDCQTDNALYNFGKQIIMEAAISPSSTGDIPNRYEWSEMYSRIRAANIAIQKLNVPEFDNSDGIAERLQGETYFLRAYYYNQLLRYYGAVPIVKTPYTLDDTDFTIARGTYEECVDFIVSDLDSAALLLKGKSLGLGRATEGAALALKARVLLYAASDLHDIPTASAESTLISGFSNKELLGYVSGSQTERWQKARDAAQAVMDLGLYGYKFDLAAPESFEDAKANYQAVFLSRDGGEADAIFSKYYINASADDWGAWYTRNNGMNGYHGWTSSQPTQNLVDDYEMMDGTKFSWDNPTHAAAPYENRDPRFYESIFYDGAPWKPRTSDGAGIDPYGEVQMGQYQTGSSDNPTTYFGLDTRNSSIENWNGTRTGYSIRKFSDPDPNLVDMNTRQEIPSPQIRFTEVVFNYVEACLELGDETTAKTWLNRIRFRAGMPAITESGDALVERYRNERNIEMLFEEQRFYDARRWMIAPETQGEKVRIMLVTGTLKPGKTVTVYRYSKDDYNYKYTVQDLDVGTENRAWHDKLYFPPISLDEMNRNDKLIQNPGY